MFTQRARYLLGFDGARSRIAEQIGLPFEGELARAGTAYIIFNADLSRYVAHRPSILHWIFNSKAGFGEIGMGLLRAIRPWNEWIAGWGFDMANGEPTCPTTSCSTGSAPWSATPTCRSSWCASRCGTSTSSTPPTTRSAGCSAAATPSPAPAVERAGLQHLASRTRSTWPGRSRSWSRATPARACSTPTPLSGPVGKQIVARANQSRKDYAGLREWFDRDSDDPVRDGLVKLKEASPEGVARRERLYEALELKNTEFNAHGVELNQRYDSGAVLPDPAAGQEEWPRHREVYLQATTRPGAKLPHAWLVDADGHRVSTLDVTGKGKMTLLTGMGGQAWKHAAGRTGPAVPAHRRGRRARHIDPYGYWHRVREIHEAGAILVRPDGYVAWRQTRGLGRRRGAASAHRRPRPRSWPSRSTRSPATTRTRPNTPPGLFPSPSPSPPRPAGPPVETVTTSGV